MHVVIDIPGDTFDYICTYGQCNKNELMCIVANGVVLPKGHGRLKDIDKIISDGISKGFCEWYDEMKYAPTIIEADKEKKINDE